MEALADGTAEQLLRIEHELARGDGATYEQHFSAGAVIVVPATSSTERRQSRRWMHRRAGRSLDRRGGGARARARRGLLTDLFRGRRGQDHYAATLSSAHIRDGEGCWSSPSTSRLPTRRGPSRIAVARERSSCRANRFDLRRTLRFAGPRGPAGA